LFAVWGLGFGVVPFVDAYFKFDVLISVANARTAKLPKDILVRNRKT
jgi:hypothetical protein